MATNKHVKNFWSLHPDEAIAANWLKSKLSKDFEVFFPVNFSFPFVDLILYNSKNKKTTTIQVKSSQGYEVKNHNNPYWASGHRFWNFKMNSNKVDFFIFSCFYPTTSVSSPKKTGSRQIVNYFVVFPTKELEKYSKQRKLSKYLKPGNRIGFSFYQQIEKGKRQLYEDWFLKKQYTKNKYENLDPITYYLDNWKLIEKKL